MGSEGLQKMEMTSTPKTCTKVLMWKKCFYHQKTAFSDGKKPGEHLTQELAVSLTC